jgi:hypothetical protein
MITKFDSLYAGHVDLDNVGYGGTPINDRRYSNEHLATALEKSQSMAVLMDRSATMRSGWRNTIFSGKAPSASRTCC